MVKMPVADVGEGQLLTTMGVTKAALVVDPLVGWKIGLFDNLKGGIYVFALRLIYPDD
jgi:hypothetical protein